MKTKPHTIFWQFKVVGKKTKDCPVCESWKPYFHESSSCHKWIKLKKDWDKLFDKRTKEFRAILKKDLEKL
jgi:hypothetical protein